MEIILLLVVGVLLWKFVISPALIRAEERKLRQIAHELMREQVNWLNEKQEKIESKGVTYIPDNRDAGVLQLVNFPYQTESPPKK